MPDIVMSAQSDRTSDYLSWLFWDADGPEIKIIKRAIAEQTVKVLRISSSMAGKILTFLMAEISVFFIFPIFFFHSSLLIAYNSKQNILFRNASKSNDKKESRLHE